MLQYTFVGFCGEDFTYRIRKLTFTKALDQDMAFFDDPENTVGNLCARLSTDATGLRGVTGQRLSSIIQASVIVGGVGAMTFYLLPKMAAVTFLFVPAIIYISFLEGKVMGSDNVVEKESIEKSCNLAVEALTNIRTVASLGAERQFLKMYEEALEQSHRLVLCDV